MNKYAISASLIALGLLASACGSDASTETTDAETDSTETTTAEASDETTAPVDEPAADETETTVGTDPTAETADAFITTSETELGTILVDSAGLTVYGFTDDTDGTPTCEGGCEAAWPAVTVDGDELPEGLDPAVFSLVDGVDGSKQLKAGDWPLYYYASDPAAGDVNGQGANDVWFVISPTGELIK